MTVELDKGEPVRAESAGNETTTEIQHNLMDLRLMTYALKCLKRTALVTLIRAKK